MSTTSFDGPGGYAAAPTPAPAAPVFTLADWGYRVAASLLDGVFYLAVYAVTLGPGFLLTFVGTSDATVGLGALLLLIGLPFYLAFVLYNLYRQGSTGSSFGKQIVGIAIVSERDARPIGFNLDRSAARALPRHRHLLPRLLAPARGREEADDCRQARQHGGHQTLIKSLGIEVCRDVNSRRDYPRTPRKGAG